MKEIELAHQGPADLCNCDRQKENKLVQQVTEQT